MHSVRQLMKLSFAITSGQQLKLKTEQQQKTTQPFCIGSAG